MPIDIFARNQLVQESLKSFPEKIISESDENFSHRKLDYFFKNFSTQHLISQGDFLNVLALVIGKAK